MIFFKMSSDLWPWQSGCGEKHVKGPTKVLFWESFFLSNVVSNFLLNFVSISNTIWQTHFQGLCWLVYTRQCPSTYKYEANVLFTINVALEGPSSCSLKTSNACYLNWKTQIIWVSALILVMNRSTLATAKATATNWWLLRVFGWEKTQQRQGVLVIFL